MKIFILTAGLIISFNIYSAGDPVPNVFTSGGTVVASEFNENFQELSNRNDATQMQVTQIAADIANLQTNGSNPLLQFIGISTGTINGISGVRAMTELCQVDYPGSRICTTEEYTKTVSFPAPVPSTTQAWISPSLVIDNGNGLTLDVYSGQIPLETLNCVGWNLGNTDGLSVNGVGGYSQSPCQNAIAVSCCR